MGLFGWKKSISLKMKTHEVYVNPDSSTSRIRNQQRINRLKQALRVGEKNYGNKQLKCELKRRELLEESAKLGDEAEELEEQE